MHSESFDDYPRPGRVLVERDRLLIALFQFLFSFKFTSKDKDGEPVRLEGNWDQATDVLNAFKEYPKSLELRRESCDDSWVLSALREHETAWLNIDEPRLGASLHGTDYVTTPLAYSRLHGCNYKRWFNSKNRDERYDYLYTPEELLTAFAIDPIYPKDSSVLAHDTPGAT